MMSKQFLASIKRRLVERKSEFHKKRLKFEKLVRSILGAHLYKNKYYSSRHELLKAKYE